MFTFIDNIVIVVRSQHDSFHENKANLFAKKIEEQITARLIKVLYAFLAHASVIQLVISLVCKPISWLVDQF